MNIEFPHLNDTKFPGVSDEETLSGVDVYKYENNFDYYRWRGQVSVKLLNVLWNSNYADVVYFNSDEERDNWFDEQEGIIQPLLTRFNKTPETNIQLPIPYNDAYKYNYVVLDMPIQTSENEPLDYESKNTRVERWYYFIEDINQLSPNTTQFIITLDYWTTFIHSVEINYLMLERGHAPMSKISVDTYLNNPIENNQYLLADDFNYQKGDTVIKASNYTPIGNGKKYVVFAAPYAPSDFALFGGTDYSGNSTPPSFADYSGSNSHYNRWIAGNQYVVNDYEWKYGETNYNNANLPIRGFTDQDAQVYNGTICYAIEASLANDFFNRMAHTRVNFIHGIQAIFILAENMFTRETGFQFEGVTIYRCHRQVNEFQYTFDKNAFGFDNKYKEITKLYTSPYSFVEITDDNGNTLNFNIENTGNLKMRSEVSLAFPWLRYNIFFTGINGNGTFNYTWKNLNDEDVSKTMWESDFSKFMLNWDIPTYSIYISSENEYAANNAAGMNAKRLEAIKDYQNATRFADTNRENMADSMQTNTNNVAATGQTNTNNVASIQAGLINNMQDTNNTHELIIDTYTNGGTFRTGGGAEGFVPESAWINYEKVSDDADTDWEVIEQGFDVSRDYAVAMATNNIGATIAGGLLSAGSANYGAKDATDGAAFSVPVFSSAVSAINTGVSTALTITNDANLKSIQQSAIVDKNRHARTASEKMTALKKSFDHDVMAANNKLNKDITERFSKTNGINNTNATRTQNTNNTNAVRTQNTETNNATETRYANIEANKANLRQAQINAEAQYKNARLHRPVKQCEYSGDAYPDIWMRRGYRFNIRTQTKAAIAQAGDAFLRFGYALHQIWDMHNGFNYMKHFTFWKAEDIWINDGVGVANIATNTISDILLKGVTVWKNPDEIGMVSIYDN